MFPTYLYWARLRAHLARACRHAERGDMLAFRVSSGRAANIQRALDLMGLTSPPPILKR